MLRAYPEVAHVIAQVGRPDDGSDPKGPNNLEVLVDLKPREQLAFRLARTALVADMAEQAERDSRRLDQLLAGDPGQRRGVAVGIRAGEIVAKISGGNLEILDQKATQVAASIAASAAPPMSTRPASAGRPKS